MLSIGILSASNVDYYTQLAQEDYYAGIDEKPGVWWGRGAEFLGLIGPVKPCDLRALFDGVCPRTNAYLTQRQATPERKEHQAGWDLTFSAPKAVSVLWALGEPSLRKQIEEAHAVAVKETLSVVQDGFKLARRGKGGLIRECADLVVAKFDHYTSRAKDPQLHSHTLVLNVGVRSDGTIGAILSKPLFEAKKELGALYRSHLGRELSERLDLPIKQKGDGLSIEGVPESLCVTFSQRRTEIVKDLNRRQLSGGAAASVSAIATRPNKSTQETSDLFQAWRDIAAKHECVLLCKFPYTRLKVPLEHPQSHHGEPDQRTTRDQRLPLGVNHPVIRPSQVIEGAVPLKVTEAEGFKAIQVDVKTPSKKGIRTEVHDHAAFLKGRGYKVLVICDSKPLRSAIRSRGLTIIGSNELKSYIGLEVKKSPSRASLSFSQMISRHGPDILDPIRKSLRISEFRVKRAIKAHGPNIIVGIEAGRQAIIRKLRPKPKKVQTAFVLVGQLDMDRREQRILNAWCRRTPRSLYIACSNRVTLQPQSNQGADIPTSNKREQQNNGQTPKHREAQIESAVHVLRSRERSRSQHTNLCTRPGHLSQKVIGNLL